MSIVRCGWATNLLSIEYHDKEWGTPVHDDRLLFEFLVLEGAQAGLSWDTILKRRVAYREAFDNFEPGKVAAYGPEKVAELLGNAGIVRNRLKVASAIRNSKVFLKIQAKFGSFSDYLWQFVDGQPVVNRWESMHDLPASTELSDTLSLDLKKRGMNFVGSTIIYAYLQAVGVVNDHVVSCFRYSELTG